MKKRLNEIYAKHTGVDIVSEIPGGVELAIISPGWRDDHLVISKLRSDGVEILSEIDFAWQVKQVLAPSQKWIALTGTNGKINLT